MSSITFGPAMKDCDECKRIRRAAGNTALNVLLAGALLASIVNDLDAHAISRKKALIFIAIIIVVVAAMAFIWGRYDGVSTLARKLNDARRREHQEEETVETEEAEAATEESEKTE